jgi:hypothetical protein
MATDVDVRVTPLKSCVHAVYTRAYCPLTSRSIRSRPRPRRAAAAERLGARNFHLEPWDIDLITEHQVINATSPERLPST